MYNHDLFCDERDIHLFREKGGFFESAEEARLLFAENEKVLCAIEKYIAMGYVCKGGDENVKSRHVSFAKGRDCVTIFSDGKEKREKKW